jgi:hypothetical protein
MSIEPPTESQRGFAQYHGYTYPRALPPSPFPDLTVRQSPYGRYCVYAPATYVLPPGWTVEGFDDELKFNNSDATSLFLDWYPSDLLAAVQPALRDISELPGEAGRAQLNQYLDDDLVREIMADISSGGLKDLDGNLNDDPDGHLDGDTYSDLDDPVDRPAIEAPDEGKAQIPARETFYRRVREACVKLREPSEKNLKGLSDVYNGTSMLRRGILPVPVHLQQLANDFNHKTLPDPILSKIKEIGTSNHGAVVKFALQQLISRHNSDQIATLTTLGVDLEDLPTIPPTIQASRSPWTLHTINTGASNDTMSPNSHTKTASHATASTSGISGISSSSVTPSMPRPGPLPDSSKRRAIAQGEHRPAVSAADQRCNDRSNVTELRCN